METVLKNCIVIACMLAGSHALHAQTIISPTRYDYSTVSAQITAGCTSKYEQAEAIYRWLCKNISYDTSYSIYTADECWDARRGVCQAYCELFYRLAEPLGLKTDIISGKSKQENGQVSDIGHAWLFVETGEANQGILVDPTWGAGSVTNNVFERSDNDMSWFHVDPEWMIFTHFPDNPAYQLLSEPLSYDAFISLPTIKPFWGLYGFNARTMLQQCLVSSFTPPKLYPGATQELILKDIPLDQTLHVGHEYTMLIGKKTACELAIVNGQKFTYDMEWEYDNENYIHCKFVPVQAGDLSLSIKRDGGIYYSVVGYTVASPTKSDLMALESRDPYAMPEFKNVQNFNRQALEYYNIDGHKLLSAIRDGSLTVFPQFYAVTNPVFKIVDIPMNGILQAGKPYTFCVRLPQGYKAAIIDSNGTWHQNWTYNQPGHYHEQTVVATGTWIKLSVQKTQGATSYATCVQYTVQ